MITPDIIANYFLALSNETQELVTNMKLNKLVYYSQAWHLAIFGKPIFSEDFEAWVHGPVLPAIYVEYKEFGSKPIEKNEISIEELEASFNPKLKELLHDIVEIYFPKTAYELEQLTHSEDPWLIARDDLEPDQISHNVITKESMTAYYSSLLK